MLADVNAVPSVGTTFPSDSVTEPTVAVSPFDPNLVALVYQRLTASSTCGLDTGIRISHDGGRTWQNAPGRPWKGTGRGPNYHGVIAWGPGPVAGSSRLWWADTTVPGCNYGAHSVSVSYSDDFGKTWAPMYVERRTPPWIGGYPDITVDTNVASPNFGVVYVAYNWLADAEAGPGLAVLASANGGRSWQIAQVARVGLSGYPAAWRIDYRVRTAPDGSAYVAFYEEDMRQWNDHEPFASGGLDNVGRVGFAVAHLHYDRVAHSLTSDPAVWTITLAHNVYTVDASPASGTLNALRPDPKWQMGFDVDQSSGRRVPCGLRLRCHRCRRSCPRRHRRRLQRQRRRLALAHPFGLATQRRAAAIGLQADAGGPRRSRLRGLPRVHRHGQGNQGLRATVGTYYAVSYDAGAEFTAPGPVTKARWYPAVWPPTSTGLASSSESDSAQTASSATPTATAVWRQRTPADRQSTWPWSMWGSVRRLCVLPLGDPGQQFLRLEQIDAAGEEIEKGPHGSLLFDLLVDEPLQELVSRDGRRPSIAALPWR